MGLSGLSGDDRAMICGAIIWIAGKLKGKDGDHARSVWTELGKPGLKMEGQAATRRRSETHKDWGNRRCIRDTDRRGRCSPCLVQPASLAQLAREQPAGMAKHVTIGKSDKDLVLHRRRRPLHDGGRPVVDALPPPISSPVPVSGAIPSHALKGSGGGQYRTGGKSQDGTTPYWPRQQCDLSMCCCGFRSRMSEGTIIRCIDRKRRPASKDRIHMETDPVGKVVQLSTCC